MVKARRIISNFITVFLVIVITILLLVHIIGLKTGGPPNLFGYRAFYVSSGSMTPTIPVGSLILVKETDPEDIKEKDIITYEDSNKTVVTHRVIEIDQYDQSFVTQGDANESEDPFPVEAAQLIGRVVFHIGYIGYIFDFIRSKYGLIALSAFLLLLLVLNSLQAKDSVKEGK